MSDVNPDDPFYAEDDRDADVTCETCDEHLDNEGAVKYHAAQGHRLHRHDLDTVVDRE
jgi:hypothetical protein